VSKSYQKRVKNVDNPIKIVLKTTAPKPPPSVVFDHPDRSRAVSILVDEYGVDPEALAESMAVRGVGSGSGWVAVVALDRGEQRGSNGTIFNVWLWLWRWLGGCKDEAVKTIFFVFLVSWRSQWRCVAWGVAVAGWQWYQSTQESKAVRMVPVRAFGCGCGGGWVAVKIRQEKMFVFCFLMPWRSQWQCVG
jgi:hypothetical protein